MFKNNDKKQRLTRQEKHNLKEFGTTDAAKINEMIKT